MKKRLFKKSKPKAADKPSEKKKASLTTTYKLPSTKFRFPNIFRSIPELHFKLKKIDRNTLIFVVCFLCGIILMGILLTEYELNRSYRELRQAQANYAAVVKEIQTWKKVMAKYPGYRDGYFHLAELEYQIGDTNAARQYNQQALAIDPNFANGLALAKGLD